MFNLKEAKVKKIIKISEGKIELELDDDSLAIAYPQFSPQIKEGDMVVVNTTAIDLGLGSGGYNYVIYNLDQKSAAKNKKDGHIMKMRYSPLQFSTLSVESQESPHHDELTDKLSIKGLPVIIGGLHSQLSSVVATAKYLNPAVRIAYIMTDGAALPIGFSDTVAELKDMNLLDFTITCNQAFGGDYEAINIYSALTCAKYIAKADIAFVSMGPGIAGTSTLLGNTAVEVGQIVNAVNSLEGKAIVIPRISHKDKRIRHQGISHHTITALTKVALSRAIIVFPKMSKKKMNFVSMQIQATGLEKKHKVEFIENDTTQGALKKYDLHPTTMGRSFEEEPEFFLSCGCGAIKALSLAKKVLSGGRI